MFEEYLQDAYEFYQEAMSETDDRIKQRYYRAATFYAASSMEAFVNYIAESFAHADSLSIHQTAFLNDEELSFSIKSGELKKRTRYYSVEDKLKFIIKRFAPHYSLRTEPSWSRYTKFKTLRDSLVHPREQGNKLSISEYHQEFRQGFTGIIEIMNQISIGMQGKPLRRQLLDLMPD